MKRFIYAMVMFAGIILAGCGDRGYKSVAPKHHNIINVQTFNKSAQDAWDAVNDWGASRGWDVVAGGDKAGGNLRIEGATSNETWADCGRHGLWGRADIVRPPTNAVARFRFKDVGNNKSEVHVYYEPEIRRSWQECNKYRCTAAETKVDPCTSKGGFERLMFKIIDDYGTE